MDTSGFRYIGHVNGNLVATAGTIACGKARAVNLQIFLDTNATYEVAVLPTTSAAGTASKNNCTAVLTDNGMYECLRPAGGSANWYLARRVYNASATGSSGGAADKYALEKLG